MKRYKILAGGLLLGAALASGGCGKKQEIKRLVDYADMGEGQIEEELSGIAGEDLHAVWGEPQGELFGMDGEIFALDEGHNLIVYYGGDDRRVEQVKIDESSEQFTGTIAEAPEGGMALVQIDQGFPICGSGDQVFISTESLPELQAGDRVRVTYSGGVMETYPLQIHQLSVEKLESETAEVDWEQAVAEAILQEQAGRYLEGECRGEGHIILKQEAGAETMTIYALTMYGEYGFQNGNFVKVSGSGAIPTVLTFRYNVAGASKLQNIRYPEDGNGYVESIHRLFPEEFWQRCISTTEEDCKELVKQERRYAEDYLKELGREAQIGDYGDFEHRLLTDAGVSVEISNGISEDRELSRYPGWIGTQERLENGRRYEYRVSLDEVAGQILFTRTDMETGEVAETRSVPCVFQK